MAQRQKSTSEASITYDVRGVDSMTKYATVLSLIEAQLGNGFRHQYEKESKLVHFATNVEIDPTMLEESGFTVESH